MKQLHHAIQHVNAEQPLSDETIEALNQLAEAAYHTPINTTTTMNTKEIAERIRKELSKIDNDEFLVKVKSFVTWQKTDADSTIWLSELITRFERITLGNNADKAIQEVIKLQEPSSKQGYVVKDKDGRWIDLITPLDSGTVNDEVEALAEKLYVSSLYEKSQLQVDACFEFAEEFINYRNERRAGNAK